jgi:hypothetical protein
MAQNIWNLLAGLPQAKAQGAEDLIDEASVPMYLSNNYQDPGSLSSFLSSQKAPQDYGVQGPPRSLAQPINPSENIIPKASLPPLPPKGGMPNWQNHNSDLEKQIQEAYKKDNDMQRKYLSDRQAEAAALGEKPTGIETMDLSPLYALADQMTGGQMAGKYKAPTVQKDWEAKKATLQNAIAAGNQDMSKQDIERLKMVMTERQRLDANDARREANALLAGSRGALGAGRLADSQIKAFGNDKIIVRADGARKTMARDMHNLLDTSIPLTNARMRELTNGIANGLAAGATSAAGDRDEQAFHTAAQTVAKLVERITSTPTEAASPEVRDFLGKNILNIYESFGHNMVDRAETLAAMREFGIPEVDRAVQNSKNAIVKSATATLLGSERFSSKPNPNDDAAKKRLEELRKKASGG